MGVIAGLATVAIAIGVLVASTPVPTVPPAATIGIPSASSAVESAITSVESVSPSPGASSAGLFHIGEPAPALAVPEVGGGTIDLARLRGRPVWVNFWGTYCPPCVDEFPLMNGYAARYADDGLVILAIDVREDEETAAAFASRLGAVFPIGLDPQGANAAAWDALVLPAHFWIDAGGIIRHGAAGGIGPDQMEAGLATILPSASPAPSTASPASPWPASPSPAPAGSPSPAAAASPSPAMAAMRPAAERLAWTNRHGRDFASRPSSHGEGSGGGRRAAIRAIDHVRSWRVPGSRAGWSRRRGR